jgi:hypothetical protein
MATTLDRGHADRASTPSVWVRERTIRRNAGAKPTIRYLGFKCATDGGRQLGFSVDEDAAPATTLLITISGALFTGPERISFQDAALICCTKLREDVEAGVIHTSSEEIRLTNIDVAQYREQTRGRHRS